MRPIEKQILINQRIIMRNLAFGFPELRKDELLNEGLLCRIEETDKILEEKESKEEPCCEMPEEFGNGKLDEVKKNG